jgi:hypothetical protein
VAIQGGCSSRNQQSSSEDDDFDNENDDNIESQDVIDCPDFDSNAGDADYDSDAEHGNRDQT